jgi:Sulfatase-modifying factor enzyme 1
MASPTQQRKIFVSHKEADQRIASILVDFILTAISIEDGDILCTSVPGHQLPFGKSIAEVLRDNLTMSAALIALLTSESLRSTWVLFELGSAWAMGKIVVPILGPGLDLSNLPGPLTNYPCINILAQDAPYRLKDAVKQIAVALDVVEKTGGKPDAKLNSFLSEFRGWTADVAANPISKSRKQPISKLPTDNKIISQSPVEVGRIINSAGISLVCIPPGEFLMGSDEYEGGYRGERPQHRISISRPFYMGIYPVVQEEFEILMNSNPSRFSSAANEPRFTRNDTRRFPVENVTWDEAVQCCTLLSELPDEKAPGRIYRLPTEAEWEYACRAGTIAFARTGKFQCKLST